MLSKEIKEVILEQQKKYGLGLDFVKWMIRIAKSK
jgi:hypothetical protein